MWVEIDYGLWRDRLDQNVVRQITISGMNQIWGPVLTSWRREDSQWTERAHRRRTSTGVDYRTQREQVLLRRVDCESQRGVSHSFGIVVPRRRYSLWTGRGVDW